MSFKSLKILRSDRARNALLASTNSIKSKQAATPPPPVYALPFIAILHSSRIKMMKAFTHRILLDHLRIDTTSGNVLLGSGQQTINVEREGFDEMVERYQLPTSFEKFAALITSITKPEQG